TWSATVPCPNDGPLATSIRPHCKPRCGGQVARGSVKTCWVAATPLAAAARYLRRPRRRGATRCPGEFPGWYSYARRGWPKIRDTRALVGQRTRPFESA